MEFKISINIRRIRKEKNVTQKQLSEKSGISQAALSCIERGGQSPTLNTLKSIAVALGVSTKDLYDEMYIMPKM